MGYWNYYYAPSRPREVKNGIKVKSKHGNIGAQWWSKQWLNALENIGLSNRLERGRNYARRGQVISIDVKPGIVTAKVQGSMPQPYSVEIKLNTLSGREWKQVTDIMASKAIFAAKLLAGEMPTNIEAAFDEASVSLFPKDKVDLKTDCSCPDIANPCKHIAAVYYILAEHFDEDPFLLFKLRGRTKEQIIKVLRAKRTKVQPEEKTESLSKEKEPLPEKLSSPENKISQLEESIETFWQCNESLDSFVINPRPPEVDNALLKRLGDPPSKNKNKNISKILSDVYKIVSETALKNVNK